jgi:hypothetical protein
MQVIGAESVNGDEDEIEGARRPGCWFGGAVAGDAREEDAQAQAQRFRGTFHGFRIHREKNAE